MARGLRPAPPEAAEAQPADGRGRDRRPRYKSFPAPHWPKISSTNPIERPNAEIKRRADVVGVFPNEAAILRLVGAVLMEQHNEWAAQDRRYMTLESLLPISDDPLASLGSPRALDSPGPAGMAR